MQNPIGLQIRVPVYYLFKDFDSLFLGDPSSGLNVVIQRVIGAVVGHDIAAIRVEYNIVGPKDIGVVGKLQCFHLVLQEVLGDFVGNVLEFDHLDG